MILTAYTTGTPAARGAGSGVDFSRVTWAAVSD